MKTEETLPMKEGEASQIEAAMAFILTAFAGQRRKCGKLPTVVHSMQVGLWLAQAGEPAPVVIAGFLHDVVEDATVPIGTVANEFGHVVSTLVAACTYDPDLHRRDKEASHEQLFRQVEAVGRYAIAIKIADVTDNLGSIAALKPDRQQQLVARAARWLELGDKYLPAQHPLLERLRQVLPK